MRKSQKRQLEEAIKAFSQAHEEIKARIAYESAVEAMELLEQCQQGAIQIGNLIEKTEGEDFPTISILEQYCELAYLLYGKVRDGKFADVDEAYERFHALLHQMASSIRNDIRLRREVVFLPYKASMWDSLESIWKAADEDLDWDAYVIPIPYYDKNPDGSFGKMHYEGELYPEYVPVTWYEDYDFAERKPEKIFIHNPYDDSNYVTSVHPFFYAKNLKQFTEQLVYVPYFVLGEVKPDERETVKEMAHFCTVPGVIHADNVIVQSEDMRQIYMNVMTEYTGEKSRPYWEAKILGLGSPKYDKVWIAKEKTSKLPKEWLEIIQKPDGKWKKIILYNTGMDALLKHSEGMIAKIRDVFGVFKQFADEVTLLWRPHPLIKATIGSMKPQLWEEYEELTNKYCEEKWGIYDDSAELDRAITISDAYYGDGSSLVQLYQEIGKPVMIQNVESILAE